MKKVYYILTGIIALLLAALLMLGIVVVDESKWVPAVFIFLMISLLAANIVGIVKNLFIPGMMLLKTGLIFFFIGVFLFLGGFIDRGITPIIVYLLLALLFFVLAIPCIIFGLIITTRKYKKALLEKEEEVKEEVKEKAGFTYRVFEGEPKVKNIWQYKLHARPQFTDKLKTKRNVSIILSIVGAILGFMIPMVLLFTFDMEEIFVSFFGLLCFMLAVYSIFKFAITLSGNRPCNTQNIAFVQCEDGSVFLIDYFREDMAREFGYYDRIPSSVYVITGSVPLAGLAINAIMSAARAIEADKCLSYIRSNDIDKKIAAECNKWGYQIVAVPEITKCDYYTEMTFVVLKDGKEVYYKRGANTYDNCYEDYDGMTEYFDTAFDHKFDAAYKRKTGAIKGVAITGIVMLVIAFLLGIIGDIAEADVLTAIAILGFVTGIIMTELGFMYLKRRRKL